MGTVEPAVAKGTLHMASYRLRSGARRAPFALLASLIALFVAAPFAHAAPPTLSDPTKYWAETFGDDFDAPILDVTKWTPCYWWANGGCTNAGNNEQQWYLPANVVMENGVAKLRARNESVVGDGKLFDYTSGMITSGRDTSLLGTPPRYQFKYGYMEMRAKVPAGAGLWPAFWALPSSHTWPPEIDAMEIKGQEPTRSNMGVHYRDGSGAYAHQGSAWAGPDFSQDFHTFGVHWYADALVWYIDGVVRYWVTDPAAIPQEPMYLLANLAVGGTFVGAPTASTPFPSDLEIDYIRVWQQQTVQAPEPEPAPDTTAPAVQMTSPVNGATVKRNATVTLAATATDSGGVKEVAFSVDGRSICTDASAPYTCTWKAPARKSTVQIAARATDTAGNSATSTVKINVS